MGRMILAIIVIGMFGVLATVAAVKPTSARSAEEQTRDDETSWFDDFGDPLPVTEHEDEVAEEKPVDMERVQLIGRLARGIRKIGLAKGGGRWWECGKRYDDTEEAEAALEWAYRIVTLAWEYSDNGSDKGITINPWEIAGIAANESGFDRCALGKWPRRWAYDHGTIKRSRLGISHKYEDIKATLEDERARDLWKTVGLDAAPLHVLWRCEDGKCWPKWNREGLPPIPMDEVFSLGLGFEYNVREMKKRAIDNRTSTPSLYWKGYKCDWYRDKIVVWQKRLGAKSEEI